MPVTITVAKHPAEKVSPDHSRGYRMPMSEPRDLLRQTWGDRNDEFRCKELLQSSFSNTEQDFSKIASKNNGFVDTVITAYERHHNLVIRPDDVWIAILNQFNYYVNANAEALRDKFVAHEGKKKLTVKAIGTRYTVDFGDLAKQMTQRIDENVVDKELTDWMLPDFSTTRDNDTVVCAGLMMGTFKAYFDYRMMLGGCGIPSVTLEGERSDWVNLLNRIEKFETFGEEPNVWAGMLRPILTRFVSSFDGNPDIDFWGKICHYEAGASSPSYVCGWITAFTVWTKEGKWQGPSLSGEKADSRLAGGQLFQLELDGARYEIQNAGLVPEGYCEVDVELDDDGVIFDCMMVSGHLAQLTGGEEGDTVSPLPSWFMFVKEGISKDDSDMYYPF